MGVRLFVLLLVAAVAGTLAGLAPKAPAAAPAAVVPAGGGLAVSQRNAAPCPIPRRFRDEFESAAKDARVPLAMLVAVATVESNLRPDARSPAGAHGLLQVLPSTAAELELDAFHVGENVLAGARYLRQMLDRFRSTELALAAYNAGPSAVDAEGVRTSDETVTYVARVTEEWRRLLGCA